MDWERHADPPAHGSRGDPHLFEPAEVEAGKAARDAVWPQVFMAGCVICHQRIHLGRRPGTKG